MFLINSYCMVERGIIHYFQDTNKTEGNACKCKVYIYTHIYYIYYIYIILQSTSLSLAMHHFLLHITVMLMMTLGYTFLPTDKWRRIMNSYFLLIVFVYTIHQSIQKINQQVNQSTTWRLYSNNFDNFSVSSRFQNY